MDTTLDVSSQSQPTTRTTGTNRPWRLTPLRLLAWLFLVAMSILFIVPFLWMLSTSLKDVRELFGTNWIPKHFVFKNYVDAFSFGMWPQWTLNTVIITFVSVIG